MVMCLLLFSFQHELAEVKRSLSHERAENERLSSDIASEKLRTRQLEREVDRVQQSLEDYRYGAQPAISMSMGLSLLVGVGFTHPLIWYEAQLFVW